MGSKVYREIKDVLTSWMTPIVGRLYSYLCTYRSNEPQDLKIPWIFWLKLEGKKYNF